MENRHLLLISFWLLFSCCVQPLKYAGEKRAPTSSVRVVSSPDEIQKPHQVMGHLTIHKYSPGIMRKYLEKQAEEVGAEAIIIPADSVLRGMYGRLTVEVLKYGQ